MPDTLLCMLLSIALYPASRPWQILEADLVLWSAGQSPVSKAASKQQPAGVGLPFPTNARGAMQTDATLRALHHQRVFALGDISVRWVGRWSGGCNPWLAWHLGKFSALWPSCLCACCRRLREDKWPRIYLLTNRQAPSP